MSKYNLIDLYEGMSEEEWENAKEADRLEKHPDRDKIKAMQALIRKEKSIKEDNIEEIEETRPGYHADGTPKSDDEMSDDEREDFYNDSNFIDEDKHLKEHFSRFLKDYQ